MIDWLFDGWMDGRTDGRTEQKYLILSGSTKNDNDVPQLTDCLHFNAIALQ